jgi:hypothetical protein
VAALNGGGGGINPINALRRAIGLDACVSFQAT